MNNQLDCPDLTQYRAMLAMESAPHELAAAEEHLSHCEACRAKLATDGGDPEWWPEASRSLRESSAETVIHARLDAEQSGVLRLLGPTDDPRMLGRIAGYEIVGILGRGGMGVVFKGFDASLNRYVAIKMLLPHLAASPDARKRFAREGQAAASVVDPHVMAIHGVAEWQGMPYLVMPYWRGVSLQKRLNDRGPLELLETLRIGLQVARGLSAAHAQGLVHRDVKPANILLAEGVERVALTDFGLARAVDDGSLTMAGVAAGTPQYMSPEQARGDAVDAQSDLFSLGSVLYAMCTGRPPFCAESSIATLRQITDAAPTPIADLHPATPDWLGAIVAKLMAKNRRDRFASAKEVADLLEGCLAHAQQPNSTPLPKNLPPPAPAAGVVRLTSSTFLFGVLAMCGIATTLLLGLFAFWGADPPDVAGTWQGGDWGTVHLTAVDPGEYRGEFDSRRTNTQGKLQVTWSRREGRFNGFWREGIEGRELRGDLSFALVDDSLQGAFTTDPTSRGLEKVTLPKLGDFRWAKARASLAGKPLSRNDVLPPPSTAEKVGDIDRNSQWFLPDPYGMFGGVEVIGWDVAYVQLAGSEQGRQELDIDRDRHAAIAEAAKLPPGFATNRDPKSPDNPVTRAKARVDALLTNAQQARLEELLWQRLGYHAFQDERLVKALKLDKQQHEAIKRALGTYSDRLRKLRDEKPLGVESTESDKSTIAERRQRVARGMQIHHQLWADIREILTPEQQAGFRKLRGEPAKSALVELKRQLDLIAELPQ